MASRPEAPSERVLAVERAIDAVRNGRMVIMVDDEDRENEGDLAMAADLVTPEAINFMARYGRGLICLSLTEERVRNLGLPMMASDNRSPRTTAFTVSIDARRGMTTGISARERAETIRAAVARDAGPDDVVTPGHIFPLRARRGGVLVRSGHTEGSVDLARLAGRDPAGVICEIMRDDGEMARMPDLEAFAQQHGLPILKIADLIEYRLSQEMLVRRVSEAVVQPRVSGLSREFRAYVYTTDVEETEYLALVLGNPAPERPALVRVQTASVLRDVFGVAADADASPATQSLRMIEEAGEGILLYVCPRGRASLVDDFGALAAAPSSAGAASAARAESRLRNFGLGAQVLAHLGVRTIRLLTNHPRRVVGVEGYGLHIIECLPIRAPVKVVPLPDRKKA
ncbi:MAG TPA: 3,4-dihydroxy-2-butanone-4-phosphate synthase [Polyangia bacterium]|jgi:3,4-dihydroxy 2-butanone 4-phosphate synthase/GTP cyclohydrolase II|nr:3,4-dihydroxy-2-butanone-4-phosphate synthase [Polyangia bacterium]